MAPQPDQTPAAIHLTLPRAVALACIVLAIVALAYLRFGTAAGVVTVPPSAAAGDLNLAPCQYDTDGGKLDAECGTLVVPENRDDPGSRLIAVPVTRIPARSDNPDEPIFRLEGGPGKTNMKFETADRFVDEHDVVLVGYRGVDGSVRLDCPEVTSVLKHSPDFLAERSLAAFADAYGTCADRLTTDGVDLAGYGLVQQVDDLEAARIALGYDRINLVSESAGTRKALIYAWRYPDSLNRSVLIAANPPGGFLWDAEITREQIARYGEACAEDAECATRTGDLAASLDETASAIPDNWFFLPIKEGNVRVGSFYALVEAASSAPLMGPMTIDSWLAAAEGDASGLWFLSFAADFFFPSAQVWGEYAAAARSDAAAAREYFATVGHDHERSLAIAATAFGWGDGRMVDGWPATPGEAEYAEMRTSEAETLVVSGSLDFATPPQWAANEILPQLPNGQQLILEGLGHSSDFWANQPEASTRLVNTFLGSGTVDASLYTPMSVDFTPKVTHTALGKGFVGTMVGVAVLTVISLAVIGRRVQRRGGFGTKASVVLRSAYPIFVGFGGWFLGVLIVLTTVRTVPLDDPLLAVMSIGLPVGVAAYLGWVPRRPVVPTTIVALVGATIGGLVGTWLGFNATGGLLALVTAVLGGVVGSNAVLMGRDFAGSSADQPHLAAAPDVAQSTGTLRT